MNKSLAFWLLPVLFVLWIFFVLSSFFVVQKPFTANQANAFGGVILNLLSAGWLTLLALTMGRWLLGRLLPSTLSFGETVILGSGLGFGVLGLLGLGLGLLKLFQPITMFGVTLFLTLVFSPQTLELARRWRRGPTGPAPGRLVTLYLTLIVSCTLLLALLPPTDWDGLFYHLAGPKRYIAAGGIVGGVDIPHLSFPSLMEMLFSWSILVRGDVAAKLLHTVFAGLLAGLAYLTSRKFFGEKSAWPAVVAFASMPMIHTLAGWAYNDLSLAFYQLASLYALINYRLSTDRARRRWLIISGLFAGLAMGLKYTSFVTPVTVGLLILWGALRARRSSSDDLRQGLTDFITFSLVALLIASPWYLKNWFFTGNPVYPFLYGLFGGQFWDGFRADWYAAANTGIGLDTGKLIALPWLLTLGVGDVSYWDGRTGPLTLLFLPLILLYGVFYGRSNGLFAAPSADETQDALSRPPALDYLLIYALAHFAFWTLGVIWSRSLWQSRLFLPGLVALAPVVGWLWADLPRFDVRRFALSRFVNVALGLTLTLSVFDIGLLTLKAGPVPVLLGLEAQDAYLTRRLGSHYAAIQEINQRLPDEAVVAFLWEPRSYYCRMDCRPDSILDEFPHLVDQYQTASAIADYWRQAGISHVLIHRTGLQFVLSDTPEVVDLAALRELETEHLSLLHDIAGAYQLYIVEPKP